MESFSSKFERHLCFGLFLTINFLFSLKYLSRYTTYYLPLAIGLTMVYIAIWHFRQDFSKLGNFNKYFQPIAIAGLIVASYFIFQRLPQELINVDRWSVITAFWDSFFRGEYVYLAKSHLGNFPGPMPVYFMIALPFYLIGEIGYMTLLGPVVFLGVLKYEKWEVGLQNACLLIILASTLFLWEIAGRSALFLNSSLVLFTIVYFLKLEKRKTYGRLLIAGILIGLCMSTRNVYVIPFLIAMTFMLRRRLISLSEFLLVGVVSFMVFAVTFLPFFAGHFDQILIMNPFVIQGSQLIPFTYVLVFIAFSIVTGFLARTDSDVHFYSGSILFIVVVAHLYHKFMISEAGIHDLFFGNVADISYFILSAPFLLFFAFRGGRAVPEISPNQFDIEI